MEQKPNTPPQKPDGQNKRPKGNMWVSLIICLAILLVGTYVFNKINGSKYTEKTYDHFLTLREAQQLAEVEFQSDRIVYPWWNRSRRSRPAAG